MCVADSVLRRSKGRKTFRVKERNNPESPGSRGVVRRVVSVVVERVVLRVSENGSESVILVKIYFWF